MKKLLKQILSLLHISVTRNQKYDAYTRKIMQKCLKPGSNCIDIGCHKGEILDLMIKDAPGGQHIGFEPIPELFDFLTNRYHDNPSVKIYRTALYDKTGVTTFQHVVNAPAYSGIRQRRYDGRHVEIREITVETGLLDHFIPEDGRVDLIKIDVEGAEFKVMKGGAATLKRCRPVVIFEFGLGAADFYESTPRELFDFLCRDCGLKISTLRGFLRQDPPLSDSQLCDLYEKGTEYYFVAHP